MRKAYSIKCAKIGRIGVSTRIEGDAVAEWKQNWTVVLAACAGMVVASLISYSNGLFIEPLEKEFHWTRAQIMSGNSIAATLAVVFAPFLGLLVDRVGPRRIGIAGVIVVCGSIALFSLATPDVGQWRLLWLPLALGIILVQPMVWTGAVAGLFSAGRGLALAATLCGSSLASFAVPWITGKLISGFGWRMAWVGLGGIVLAITLPIIFLFLTSKRDRERTAPVMQIDAILRQSNLFTVLQSGVLSRRFLQLLVAGVLIVLVVVTMAVSTVPILSASHIDRNTAILIAGLIGVTSIIGRLSAGALLDRMDGRFIAAACVCLPVVGLLLLLEMPGSVPAAVIAVLIFGLSMGAELDIFAYLTSRYFRSENFGFLFGTLGGFLGLATGNGPFLLNKVYDITGSYAPAMWAAMPLCLLSAVLLFFLGPYPENKA